jgi:hypothetical protein
MPVWWASLKTLASKAFVYAYTVWPRGNTETVQATLSQSPGTKVGCLVSYYRSFHQHQEP